MEVEGLRVAQTQWSRGRRHPWRDLLCSTGLNTERARDPCHSRVPAKTGKETQCCVPRAACRRCRNCRRPSSRTGSGPWTSSEIRNRDLISPWVGSNPTTAASISPQCDVPQSHYGLHTRQAGVPSVGLQSSIGCCCVFKLVLLAKGRVLSPF